MTHDTTQMDFKIITLSDRSQTKNKYTLKYGLIYIKFNKMLMKLSQQKVGQWSPGHGAGKGQRRAEERDHTKGMRKLVVVIS